MSPARNEKGFSLIELMIVGVMVAILMAVVIPSYRNHLRKANIAEMKANLGEIKILQGAYRAENDVYLSCPATPAAVPTGDPVAWAGGGKAAFDTLKFTPSGEVHFQYQVTASGAASFSATARADMDNDGTQAVYTITNAGTVTGPVPADEY